ncbi:MAG: DNA topoisomerase I [Armatimonadetes bacterium RBG_16_67_12]|nr:MAG: DNA topoisomerase I [Armatimonadetes bacterium RBG_16_67_12]
MAAAKSLVVVESPTKARTLSKLLSRTYEVKASMGHVKDLPKSQLGVNVDDDFAPKYIVIKGKGPIIKELKDAAKKASTIYMATDPDREGEAISWHLSEVLRPVNPSIRRIEFHEVTKEAVQRALKHPREIDQNLVNAQQARRILDRLVGYKLSPLLWRKIRGGLSAGRVQSVAVRLIVDREREIEAFVPREYWSIAGQFRTQTGEAFTARLVSRNGQKFGAPSDESATIIGAEAEAAALVEELRKPQYAVGEVRRKDQVRNPAPPFTTSTLQQEANRKLGFSASRTMAVAQQLYEGLDVGAGGTVGLITYMRTDSVRVAASAQHEAREFIGRSFGDAYIPEKPRFYRSRRDAQDAHEAIRPTGVARTPERVKPFLRSDQYRLYRLIWERFLASQMASAILDTLSVDITGGDFLFRATGSRVKFPGYLILYHESTDNGDEEGEGWLPPLASGDGVTLREATPEQHFTQPPPRYTEATLVRALEERGIGRPSTYAPTIETIKKRGYAHAQQRRLVPTDVGRMVTDLLVEHFPEIVDVDFTAGMEDELDHVEEGRADWLQIVRSFYEPFAKDLQRAEAKIPVVEIPEVEIGEPCPQCGRPLVRKHGRFGEFIACSGYPECKYTRPVGIGVICPRCGGEIVARRTKRGRTFYGCGNYPACTFTSWDRPSEKPCPKCGSLTVIKRSRRGTELRCTNEACGHREISGEGAGATSRRMPPEIASVGSASAAPVSSPGSTE